jgi:hydrogenase expression/formation protein HypE
MNDRITLNHGSGGGLTGKLIREIFTSRFGMPEPLTDAAVLMAHGQNLAFTTDSYVVDPIFFPGGDIGKLAVCGTVNDLAVAGAIPLYLSAAFIIEEGFPLRDLISITASMAEEALWAGIKIVTGDTKVVEKGKCDKIFITTSGTGLLSPEFAHIGTAIKIRPGDKLIINGPVGNHSIAVLGARKGLAFNTPVLSDCSSLNHMIRRVLENCCEIHFMRDLTRGGLATVLNELSEIAGNEIVVNELSVPVDEPVRGLCEIMGFDPLYLSNEGKVLIAADEKECEKVLRILRSDPFGTRSEVIGEISPVKGKLVVLNTSAGGKRILNLHTGIQLPRIC